MLPVCLLFFKNALTERHHFSRRLNFLCSFSIASSFNFPLFLNPSTLPRSLPNSPILFSILHCQCGFFFFFLFPSPTFPPIIPNSSLTIHAPAYNNLFIFVISILSSNNYVEFYYAFFAIKMVMWEWPDEIKWLVKEERSLILLELRSLRSYGQKMIKLFQLNMRQSINSGVLLIWNMDCLKNKMKKLCK